MHRVQFILLKDDYVFEEEVRNVGLDGISLHYQRVHISLTVTRDSLAEVAFEASDAFDVRLFACTSGSIINADKLKTFHISSAFDAVRDALSALSIIRIGLITHSVSGIAETFVAELTKHAFVVTAQHSFGEDNEKRVSEICPDQIRTVATEIGRRRDVDGVLISCSNLRCMDVIRSIERDTGKPVVTTNQAILWKTMRLLGRSDALDFGQLLRTKAGAISRRGVSGANLSEFDPRMCMVREEVTSSGVDVFLCTCPNNIFYLTGFQTPGNAFTVLVISRKSDPYIITRKLEGSNAHFRTQLAYATYRENESGIETVSSSILRFKPRKIGYEASSSRLTTCRLAELRFFLPGRAWIDMSRVVSMHRTIKTSAEIACVRTSAACVDAGIHAALSCVQPGMSELQVAGRIHESMMSRGCEYTSYPLFVSSGDTGEMTHYAASGNVIREGDVLFMEVGACTNRYHAARMHTVWVGDTPPIWFKELSCVILCALETGRLMMKSGERAGNVDAQMRKGITEWLDARQDISGTMSECSGYGIGIGLDVDWSEVDLGLSVHPHSETMLEENMTFHLIPWVQLRNIGAVGFSDTVVVGRECAESLFPITEFGSEQLAV